MPREDVPSCLTDILGVIDQLDNRPQSVNVGVDPRHSAFSIMSSASRFQSDASGPRIGKSQKTFPKHPFSGNSASVVAEKTSKKLEWTMKNSGGHYYLEASLYEKDFQTKLKPVSQKNIPRQPLLSSNPQIAGISCKMAFVGTANVESSLNQLLLEVNIFFMKMKRNGEQLRSFLTK